MDKEKEETFKKMDELTRRAKEAGVEDIGITLKPGCGISSLNEVIKTQEQADFFMKMLKALQD
jgi:hypothetical protein